MKNYTSNSLAFSTLIIYFFLYMPLFVLMAYSFNSSKFSVGWEQFTLHWYIEVFKNKEIQKALLISLCVTIPCVIISTIIGTATAITLYRSKFKGKSLFQGILCIPLIMPSIVIGISLLLLYNFINMKLGILSILFAHVAFSIPLTTLVILGRMQRINRAVEEAAMDLGADEWTTFTKVTLPLLKPGIFAAAFLTFPWSFNDFVITFFVSGVGSTTLPIRIYSMIRLGVTPKVHALGSLIVLVSVISILIGMSFERGKP